jgi:hypothetical protein
LLKSLKDVIRTATDVFLDVSIPIVDDDIEKDMAWTIFRTFARGNVDGAQEKYQRTTFK